MESLEEKLNIQLIKLLKIIGIQFKTFEKPTFEPLIGGFILVIHKDTRDPFEASRSDSPNIAQIFPRLSNEILDIITNSALR